MTRQNNGNAKRHCMIVHAYYPLGETRVEREAAVLVDRGYQVDILCLRRPGSDPEEQHRSTQVYRLPVKINKDSLLQQFLSYVHFFILAAFKVAQLHRRRPYDTVQVHNLPDFLVFCALVPKLQGVPIILDLHDLMPEFYAGRFVQGKGALIVKLIRWQERMACRFADHVVTVSDHWRQALIQRGVPAQKCSVVMNVAEERIFQPPNDPDAYLPKGDELRMIYHGAIVQRYGLDLVLEAMAQVRHEIPNIHLTIVGGGGCLEDLQRMTEELRLNGHVAFENGRLADELPAILRTANLGVVAYRNDVFTDSLLPTKLMEYAAMGMPAIAARTTAIEATFGGTNVEFFQPGDVEDLARCMRTLHNSPERLAELARGSARFNERSNWTKLGAEYADLVSGLGA
jgi:glycosyltransferase involved in cell wall biosynthesis